MVSLLKSLPNSMPSHIANPSSTLKQEQNGLLRAILHVSSTCMIKFLDHLWPQENTLLKMCRFCFKFLKYSCASWSPWIVSPNDFQTKTPQLRGEKQMPLRHCDPASVPSPGLSLSLMVNFYVLPFPSQASTLFPIMAWKQNPPTMKMPSSQVAATDFLNRIHKCS